MVADRCAKWIAREIDRRKYYEIDRHKKMLIDRWTDENINRKIDRRQY